MFPIWIRTITFAAQIAWWPRSNGACHFEIWAVVLYLVRRNDFISGVCSSVTGRSVGIDSRQGHSRPGDRNSAAQLQTQSAESNQNQCQRLIWLPRSQLPDCRVIFWWVGSLLIKTKSPPPPPPKIPSRTLDVLLVKYFSFSKTKLLFVFLLLCCCLQF